MSLEQAPKKKTPLLPHERAFHPLFPAPPDAAPEDLAKRDITWIYVTRNREAYPRPFSREELTDPCDLFQNWGGGTYECRAKDTDKRGWTANATYTFSGAPKPFAAPDPAPAAYAPAPATSDPHSWINLALAVVGAVTPLMTAHFDRQDRRDALAREQERAAAERHEAHMRAQLAQQHETNKLFVSVLTTSNQSNQNLGLLEKGIAIGKEVGAASFVDDDSDALGSIGEVLAGFQRAKTNPADLPS